MPMATPQTFRINILPTQRTLIPKQNFVAPVAPVNSFPSNSSSSPVDYSDSEPGAMLIVLIFGGAVATLVLIENRRKLGLLLAGVSTNDVQITSELISPVSAEATVSSPPKTRGKSVGVRSKNKGSLRD